jgi:hypothetical protein
VERWALGNDVGRVARFVGDVVGDEADADVEREGVSRVGVVGEVGVEVVNDLEGRGGVAGVIDLVGGRGMDGVVLPLVERLRVSEVCAKSLSRSCCNSGSITTVSHVVRPRVDVIGDMLTVTACNKPVSNRQ